MEELSVFKFQPHIRIRRQIVPTYSNCDVYRSACRSEHLFVLYVYTYVCFFLVQFRVFKSAHGFASLSAFVYLFWFLGLDFGIGTWQWDPRTLGGNFKEKLISRRKVNNSDDQMSKIRKSEPRMFDVFFLHFLNIEVFWPGLASLDLGIRLYG